MTLTIFTRCWHQQYLPNIDIDNIYPILSWIFSTHYNSKIRVMEENIGNHGYIGTSILRIYRIYRRYIDGYFGKKYR